MDALGASVFRKLALRLVSVSTLLATRRPHGPEYEHTHRVNVTAAPLEIIEEEMLLGA